jgi:ubiquinone biosynthesis monooxygenase Coq7
MTDRYLSPLDRFISVIDNGMRAIFSKHTASRQSPAEKIEEENLISSAKKHSAGLMRVNHTGEICAQALYYGQAMVARSSHTKNTLLKAGEEETDHLAWCQERIIELDGHTSYLNPFWYTSSFILGLVVGAMSDKWSLGFVVETERQVERHLKKHLDLLPTNDFKSKQILETMKEDEMAHATIAMGAGAIELPEFVKNLMKVMSKIMTKVTYYI